VCSPDSLIKKQNSHTIITLIFYYDYRSCNLQDCPDDVWTKYCWINKSQPYTRNLIATDGASYSLLLLCWNAGKESPIHNHPCDGCWLQVLSGKIREVRYNHALQEISNQVYSDQDGGVSYITDQDGYHKVCHEGSEEEVAMTLHVYAPPFSQCKVWNTPNYEAEGHVVSSTNYSEFGKLLL
jgi:cysteine dioxygenase